MTHPRTAEQFEALLIEVRDSARATLTDFAHEAVVDEQSWDASIDDARAVWHAAEFALGMVSDRYVIKREAVADARTLLERYDEDAD
jgi:hypothetical protein